jgi:hypothetical protein
VTFFFSATFLNGPKFKQDTSWMTRSWTKRNHQQKADGSNARQVWLTRNEDLHGRNKKEKERKRLKKSCPRITPLRAKQDFLLAACNEPTFKLPIHDRMQTRSQELKTWASL